jgi:aminoglycoside phosphotransferase (APT) family kinase protein
VLTEHDVRASLDTDDRVHRMFLNDEFDVWAVGGELVAKFARTDVDAAKMPSEQALHPTIRRLLGDVVPPIRKAGPARDGRPPFIVHERAAGVQGQTIDGVTITPSDGLAVHIAALFAALHQVDGAQARALGAGERTVTFDVPDISDETLAATTEIAGDNAPRFLGERPPAPSDRRTLCHTDVKGEHVFVDDERRRVSAIIDWADAEVCDPAKDYAGLVGWLGPSFTRACVEAGGEDDPTLAERAIWLARAGMLGYWDDVLAGRERAPIRLITEQLRTAFSD